MTILLAGGIGLSACSTTDIAGTTTVAVLPIPPGPPVVVDIALLPGKWGLASYREDKDIPRTTKRGEVRLRQSLPDRGKGPGGGVMMHLADQAQPTEVVLKRQPAGAPSSARRTSRPARPNAIAR